MSGKKPDRGLGSALKAGLLVDRGQEDALWADFQARREREAEAWAAFAAAMVVAGRRLGMVLRGHTRPGFHRGTGTRSDR